MEDLLQFLQSLTPDQQAVLGGLIASILMYGLRFIPAAWEEITAYGKKKFRATVVAAVLALIAAYVTAAPDGLVISEFVWLFAVNFLSSQGAHTLAKNINRSVMGE